MKSVYRLAAVLLAASCAFGDASAFGRRYRATDAAREFVPLFVAKRYEEARAVATFDPSEWASWFDKRFPTIEPFLFFRIFEVERQGPTSLVHVRIAGESIVYGLYVRVNSDGKVSELVSIRELLDEQKKDLDAASTRTTEILDAIERAQAPASEIRKALRDHKRAAAEYLRVIAEHLEMLEGEMP